MSSTRYLILLGMFVASTFVWGQSTNTVDAQFARYHELLTGTANLILTAPTIERSTAQSTADSTDSVVQFNAALSRVQKLRPLIEPILREEGVPTDIAAIVLVESGGRIAALSPKGALGLWQLMPQTARRYGLTVSPVRDERTDPMKSTRAAARYLRDLYAEFADWRLAFAAYNAGEQAVQRAILRAASRDFHSLNNFLPNETRAYVPAVLTARSLFGRANDHSGATLRAARTAAVLYASARLSD